MESELTYYLRLFKRWYWAIALTALIVGGVTYQVYSSRKPLYRASTTIAIGTYIRSPNPDTQEIATASDLARTYEQLVKSRSVLQGAIEALDLPSSTNLRNKISTQILPDTSLLVVTVTDSDPELAARIANEIARQLIIQSPTNLTPEQQAQIELAENRIAALSTILDGLSEEYNRLETELLAAQYPDDINRIQARRDVLVQRINGLSDTIAQYSSNIALLQQRKNSLDVVEVAQTPTSPNNVPILQFTLLGAFLGAAVVMGAVMAKEYFRNTFETSREAAQALELPILGAIKRHARFRKKKSRRLITDSHCEESIVEAYQTLQTNIQYISNDNDRRVYLITSPGPNEGKTITAANLAISMTKAGFRVVLVDGDLRKPQIHEIFGIANSKGVGTFLMSGPLDAVPSGNNKNEYKNALEQLIQKTAVPKLSVISSGPQVEHPNEMFGSGRLIDFFEMICTSSEIDTVVIDSPPCLLVPDTLRLANVVNAQVILVLEAGRTSRSSALKAKERFALVGKNITGIVLTKISRPEEDYFGHRSSYRYYGGRFGARPSLKLRLMALIHGREIKEERRYQTSRSDDPHATLFISEDGLREVREQLKTQREPSEQPTETPSEQVAAPATRPARETICPKCGASNALDASFCVQCRTQLPRTLQLDPSVLDKVSAEQTPIVSEKTLELRFPETSQTLRVAVNQDQLIIGRNSGEGLPGPDIDLAPYDAVHHGVSRYHASLTCQGDTLVIKDLESLNHTYINGLRLYPHEARVLRNDDVLMLGELVMHVNLGAPVDSPSQPDQN